MKLKQLAEDLLNTAADFQSTDSEINAVTGLLYEEADKAAPDDVNEAVGILSSGLGLEDAVRGGFLAKVCIALVEYGGNVSNISAALIEKLRELLISSEKILEECLQQMPSKEEISKRQEDKTLNQDELFEKIKKQVAVYMSCEAEAWETLDIFWPPAIEMFSINHQARTDAHHLISYTSKLAQYQNGSYWLDIMLKVLHDEPILVIEPEKQLGIVGRMSGVAGNFQLHMLLMDVFPQRGWFKTSRVPSYALEVAKGSGPQQTEDIVYGQWNMYSWQALQPNLQLPDPKKWSSDKYWIWGEGIPADIPVFENHRVILLGPPSYPRTWRLQRLFKNLPAKIEVVKNLSRLEIKQWLQQIAKEAE